jgi:RHS repeat-associated protein
LWILRQFKKYVYLTDQLGSVRDVVDASTGSLVGSLDYSPYGQVQRKSGTVSPLIQYGQLPWDNNAGLSVSATRFYDAGFARWMSRDPIREAGGINLYGYVGGSPLSLIDPTGLDSDIPFPDIGGLLWGAGVTAVGGMGYIWNNNIAPMVFPSNSSPAPNSTPSPTPGPAPVPFPTCSPSPEPKRCKLQSDTIVPFPTEKRRCIYRCKDHNGRLEPWLIPAFIRTSQQCPENMNWIDRGADGDGFDIIR